MDLSYGADADVLRKRVRQFVAECWQPAGLRGVALRDHIAEFRRAATTEGFLYRGIPQRYGGSEQPSDGLTAQVIREEFARARAPMEVGGNGLSMLVPTLLDHGAEWQKEMFIPATVTGEFVWGQGYSEPSTGSDLASVRLRGELRDGEWVLNGQKTWTSQGREATHMFALVRTEPEAPKHEGISYLLLDLNQPGVTRRPIRQIDGRSDFCEFFFDDARTPSNWIVGSRGGGWRISRTTLKHERASIGSAETLGRQFGKLLELARSQTIEGRPAIENPLVREALGRIEGWVMSHRYTSQRLFSLAIAGEEPGIAAMMMKLLLTETGKDIARLAQDLLGRDGAVESPADARPGERGPSKWLDQIFGSLGNSIAGGTTNIQRNIIAERGLGLPRDLAMERDR
jgi:alkylation response protein AidB-like acyl-CoA dehydrogenase